MPIERRFRPGRGLGYWRIDLLPCMEDSRIIGLTNQDHFPGVLFPHEIAPFQIRIRNKAPVIHRSHDGDPRRKVFEIHPLVRPHEGHKGGGPDFIVPGDPRYFLYLILMFKVTGSSWNMADCGEWSAFSLLSVFSRNTWIWRGNGGAPLGTTGWKDRRLKWRTLCILDYRREEKDKNSGLTISKKVVTPAETGVQRIYIKESIL